MPTDFKDLRVAAFESRLATEMSELIERHNGVPVGAPSMRELPLEQNTAALDFAEQLFNHEFDVVILLTGVGTRTLAEVISTAYPRERFVDELGNVTTVARGPKPVSALREIGLQPTLTVPEPNTWRDIISMLDGELSLEGRRVAIQEYGASNPDLIAALEERGAQVVAVPVYRWALPEDLQPLRGAIRDIVNGDTDIVLFTSSIQVRHLFVVASDDGLDEGLRQAFKQIVIGSIGPLCSEMIASFGLVADYEPERPRMAVLVREMSQRGPDLVAKKRVAHASGVDTNSWRRADMIWSVGAEDMPLTVQDSLFLKACRCEPVDVTPIWIMRQAGRYLREYRELRKKVSFLELCKKPELAAEVTLMAVDRLGVDAAILFADILLVLEPMGIGLEYSKAEGPIIGRPVRSAAQVNEIADVDVAELAYVFDAARLVRRALSPGIPLIGFAGAPFTVASYLIEGGASRTYQNTKAMMYRTPSSWHELMEKLTTTLTVYLNGQIGAGADAVQLFDSWVGCLSPDDYRSFVLPHVRRLINGITKGTPVIHFTTGNPALLESMRDAGGDVMGLDWRVDLADARVRLGDDVVLMGNLDPVALFATPSEIRKQAQAILDKARGLPGHIFNLGHGVLPGTPPENVLALVDAVHELSAVR